METSTETGQTRDEPAEPGQKTGATLNPAAWMSVANQKNTVDTIEICGQQQQQHVIINEVLVKIHLALLYPWSNMF